MITWIIGASIRFRLLVLVAVAALLAVALYSLRDTPVDALPEYSPPQVQVQTEAPGLAAAEVEQLLTVPLEADLLNGVPWLSTIRSESVPGLSSITLVFEPGTDPLRARQVVNERVTQAKALPNVASPPIMLEPLSSDSRVQIVALTPKAISAIDASVLARYTVRPRLMSVPGVANVVIWGQRDRQLQVLVDPARLAAADVSISDVVQAAGNAMWVSPLSFLEASSPGSGGFIDTANQRLGVQHIQPIASPETLAQVTVEDTPNRVVHLGDVSTVVADHPPMIGEAANDGDSGLLLVVEKAPGANTLEVTRGVQAALDDLRPGLAGVSVDSSVFRAATYLDLALGHVGLWLLLAAVLLIAVVALMLFAWRAVLVVLLAMVCSLAAALLGLRLAGATANAVVLAGLVVAVAIVIDDAVLDVDRIRAELDAGRASGGGGPVTEMVARASRDVRGSLLHAGAAGALAALPVFVIAGQQRDLYSPLTVAYLITIAASMLVALVVTPALSTLLLRPDRATRRDSPVLRRLSDGYQGLLSTMLRRRRRFLVATAVLLLVGVLALPLLRLGPRLLPPLKDPTLLVELTAAPGTSLPEMDRISDTVGAALRLVPGVRGVGSHIGRAVLGDQVVDVNSAELWVSLDSSADYGGTLQEIRSVVAGYPGLHGRVSTYQQSRTEEILGQRPSDITVRVFGQDPDVLATKAGEVARMLAGIDGIVAPRVVTTPKQPMLLIEPDLTAAQQLGIKPGDIRRGATALLSGITVGSLYQDQKVFDVVVRGTPATQHSLASVKGLVLDTPHDGHVRLGDVADVRIESRPTVIERADVSRMVDVTASVRGRSVGAVSRDVAARLPSISFPLEHHAELLADPTAGADGAGQRELAVCLAVVIGIFLLLQGACGGWRLAAAILLTVPVALAGSVLATLADGRVLSLGALAGGLTVLALTLRHTVSFVRHGQRLRDRDSVAFGPDLVRRTATQRLRPVLTITFAVATVMLPALLMGDMAGLEIVHPLAVSVLGGLVTATFVALVVVPLLYLRGGADLPAAAAESDIVTDPVVPAQKSATADERRARRGGPRR